MGPPESPTGHPENQEGRRKRLARQPRTRCCLLKGCERRFHPRQARQRYCSERRGGRRNSDTGRRRRSQQKRNGQGRRYRDRVKNRKPAEPEAVNDAARVITTKHFFRPLLRPAELLRRIRLGAAKSLTALLFARLPPRAGTGPGTGAALETGARFNPEILIGRRRWSYISLSDATGVSPARPALGAPASAPSGAAAAVAGVAGR